MTSDDYGHDFESCCVYPVRPKFSSPLGTPHPLRVPMFFFRKACERVNPIGPK